MSAPDTTHPKTPKKTDWNAIEPHYRAGIRSLKDIGKEFDVSDAGIIKHAKKMEWTRDLAAKIKAKAEAKVSAAAVSALVSEQRSANEQTVVEANAEMQYRIRMAQRTDIQRARKLTMNLLGELEVSSDNHELMGQLGSLMQSPDERGVDKLNELYRKVTSLTGRVGNMKQLAESLKTLVGLEREAFGLNVDEKPPADDLTALLMGIAGGNGSAFTPVQVDPERDE